MSKLLDENYQRLLKPFKSANVYYPSTLQTYLEFTKRELDPDETMLEHSCGIIETLLRINETTFPHECKIIREKFQNILFMNCG